MRTTGDTGLSPLDDELIAMLHAAGFSAKRISAVMGCSDKTVVAAKKRHLKNGSTLPKPAKAELERVLRLHAWIQEGIKYGFIARLSALLGSVGDRADREVPS